MKSLRIALSKGRIFDETMPLLEDSGIVPSEHPERSRKLVIPATQDGVEFLIVRASDVPTYVQYGGADIGIVGKDVLMEHGGLGLLETVDLEIARCRLMVAGPADFDWSRVRRCRVATKFTACARRHFAQTARQVELIKLYGSMELAPLTGLAELIVDVVDTGNTLRANDLEPLEHIADISSRLIVNPASMKTRHDDVNSVVEHMRRAVQARRAS